MPTVQQQPTQSSDFQFVQLAFWPAGLLTCCYARKPIEYKRRLCSKLFLKWLPWLSKSSSCSAGSSPPHFGREGTAEGAAASAKARPAAAWATAGGAAAAKSSSNDLVLDLCGQCVYLDIMMTLARPVSVVSHGWTAFLTFEFKADAYL